MKDLKDTVNKLVESCDYIRALVEDNNRRDFIELMILPKNIYETKPYMIVYFPSMMVFNDLLDDVVNRMDNKDLKEIAGVCVRRRLLNGETPLSAICSIFTCESITYNIKGTEYIECAGGNNMLEGLPLYLRKFYRMGGK